MALSLLAKAKQYFTSKSQDNEGWIRKGKFTPLQQISSQINYQKQNSPINRALYTGLETAGRPVYNSLLNIGALEGNVIGALQSKFGNYQGAQKSFDKANRVRQFTGTQGSFDQGTGWNTIKKGGIDAIQTALTGKGLKYVTPTNLGISGLLSGGASKLSGGDFATGVGQGMGATPSIMGFVGMTNPILSKVLGGKLSPLVAGKVGSRLTPAIANVAQGVGLDLARGTPTTLKSMGLDLATGLAGGKGQFDMGTNFSMPRNTMDEVIKAEDMLLNPQKYLENTISVTKKNANSIRNVQIKKIQEEAAKVIDQISAKYLPNEVLKTTSGNVKAQIKALVDLSGQNKLANVNYIYGGKEAQGYKPNMEGQFSNMADKKVRFEIDDSKAKLIKKPFKMDNALANKLQIPNGKWPQGKLSEFIDHPELFKNYPEFKNIDVIINEPGYDVGARGYFDSGKNQLFIDHNQLYDYKGNINEQAEKNVKSIILHELQHSIQTKEGFAKGGSLESASQLDPDTVNEITGVQSVLEDALKQKNSDNWVYNSTPVDKIIEITSDAPSNIKEWAINVAKGGDNSIQDFLKETPYNKYQRLSGEIESRDVSARMDLTPEQRAKTQPYVSQGIPQNEWITKFDDSTSLSKVSTPEVKTGGVKIKEEPKIKIKGQSQESKLLPPPELSTKIQQNQKLPQSTQKPVVSSQDIIPSSKKLSDSVQRVKQETELNNASAEVNKQIRQLFPEAELERINRVKKIARSKAFLEGDIETLRKLDKNGDVEKVIQQVRIAKPDIIDDADALDYALTIPTKSSTVSKRPVLSQEEKNIRLKTIEENKRFLEEQYQLDEEISGVAGDPKSIFKESGATLTKKQFETKKVANLKIQSEGARKAQNEADAYFKSISTPAYKKGTVNLGDQLPADELLRAKKDKMAFSYQRETIQRNIEDIFGRDSKMKKYVVDNITNNENQSTTFQNTLRTKLATTFKNANIKKGSKEDYAAADFIEGTLTLEQLKKEFPNKWQGIIKASEEGRAVYKELLSKINTTLKRFGYEPIPERQNYVTHTNQIQTLSERIGSLTNLSSDELPRVMAGINLTTKPGRKFFSFGLQRKGGSTHEGLITALDKYIPSASRQIFHTEDIQRGRAVLSFLQKSADEGDTRLSGFTSYFSQFVDHLAGKQNIIDRPIEKIFGRKFLAVGDWVRKRTGANMVGANLSSAATNFIPFTQSAATTSKPAFARGLLQSVLNIGKEPSVIDGVQSGFLLRRFAKERITGTLGENIKDNASLPFKLVDKFTSVSIVAGKYFEQLAKGLSPEKAMALADDYAQRVMADRSFAQSPLLFNSRVLGFLTQFQLEVNNQMSFLMKDIPKNLGYSKAQVASSLVQFGVYAYLFNNLYEKVIGRRPQIDPIEAVLTTTSDLESGKGLQSFSPVEKDPYTKKVKISNTGTGQILNQLPFTSIGGGRIPITSALENPQYYLLPPFGGGQLKKTIEGIGTVDEGGSYNKSGELQYPIEQNLTNYLKGGLFGRSSLPKPEGYEYPDSLTEKQTKEYKSSPDKQAFYNQTLKNKEIQANLKGEGFYNSDDSAQTKLQKTITLGKSIITDPKTTIKFILDKQPIRKVENGFVVGERKQGLGQLDSGNKATEIDHIVPLEFSGGNPKKSNKEIMSDTKDMSTTQLNEYLKKHGLEALTIEEHKIKTQYQKYLSNELKAKKLTKKEVLEKMANWRNEVPNLPKDTLSKFVENVTTEDTETTKKTTKKTSSKKASTKSKKKVSLKKSTIKLSKLPEFKAPSFGKLGTSYKTIARPNIKLSKPKIVLPTKTKSNTIKIKPMPTMKVAKGGFLG